MKINKIFVGFAVLLTSVLGYGYYEGKKNIAEKVETKEVRVGVLQLLSHPALDQIYKGIEEGLAKEGYQIGKDIKIDLQNAQGDQSNLVSMGQKLVSDNNDILVGITTPATLALSNATKDKPIIMAGITYPVEAGLIKSENNPGNNITGVSDRTPIKQQLEAMKQILPKMKKVGILYTASEDNSVKQAQEAEKLAKELGLEVLAPTHGSNLNSFITEVNELLGRVIEKIYQRGEILLKEPDKHFERVYIVIDELLALVQGSSKQSREAFGQLLGTIALLGRQTSISLILCSQRFDATAFAGNTAVREQINCVFILGEINANTCQFLLPNTNVDNIVVPSGIGTGIVKFTDNEHRTHIMPLLTPTYTIRKEQST